LGCSQPYSLEKEVILASKQLDLLPGKRSTYQIVTKKMSVSGSDSTSSSDPEEENDDLCRFYVPWRNRTEEKLLLIAAQVNRELQEMQRKVKEQREFVDELNKSITSALYPEVDALVEEYRQKIATLKNPNKRMKSECTDEKKKKKNARSKVAMTKLLAHLEVVQELRDEKKKKGKLTDELGDRILSILPGDGGNQFYYLITNEEPMLVRMMNDETFLIFQLYASCKCWPHSDAWDDVIPAYLARDVEQLREKFDDEHDYE
jgi:hypothetical protein